MAYSISGTITWSGGAFPNVMVEAFYDGAVVGYDSTDASGAYTLPGLTDALTYTVIPRFPGYTFTPASEDVALSGADEVDVDFLGAQMNLLQYLVPGTSEVEWAVGSAPTARSTYRGPVGALDALVPGFMAVVEGLWGGTADSVTKRLLGGRTDYCEWDVEWAGWESILQRRLISLDYASATSINTIIAAIDSQVLDAEGIEVGTIDGGTETLFYPHWDLWPAADVLDKLAETVGGYWYIDAWPRKLHLRQFGAVAAPWALSTAVEVWNVTARHHRDEYYNIVYAAHDTDQEYAVDAAGMAARAAVEGGTGRYERVVSVPSDYSSAQLQEEADLVLARHNELGWEVTYTTREDDLRIGMEQEVNLSDEFNIPAATNMRIERLVRRAVESGAYEWDVTLRTVDYGGTWERQMGQAFMPGSFGVPRYYHP